MKIAINEIKVNAGWREASLNGIDELTRSISEVGLLNPITVIISEKQSGKMM